MGAKDGSRCAPILNVFSDRYMLSPVRLSVVCNVSAPYTQVVQIFCNFSTALGTLAIH